MRKMNAASVELVLNPGLDLRISTRPANGYRAHATALPGVRMRIMF